MKIFNTLSGKKEDLKPLNKERLNPVRGRTPEASAAPAAQASGGVNFFVCGPTVYDSSHIGHARTYVFFDAAVRYLRNFSGLDVFYLQNITDIDDKIINRANELGQNPLFLSRHFAKEYFSDMKGLKINSVSKYAPATKFIPEIVSQIKRLIKKGYVYEIPADGLYFDIKKFPDYGKLSGRTAAGAEDAVSRIDESIKKRNKGDFCVWKFEKPKEPSWKSPWGKGRPGWHIEDTAISEHFFGPRYDIHGGGVDLKFPHHESEIAQQESASGKKPFVRIWMHTGHLSISGVKMSKSIKNFITIRDLLKRHSAEAFRLLVLQNHYRSPLNYTEESIRAAEEGVKRIAEFILRLHQPRVFPGTRGVDGSESSTQNLLKNFTEAMNDDFDTPRAIAGIFEFIKNTNRLIDENNLTKKDASEIKSAFKKIDSVFGIIPKTKTEKIPEKIKKLAELREQFRKNKDWKMADEIRKKIRNSGYNISDTPSGILLKKLNK